MAIPIFELALDARERVLGPDHPDSLTSRHNLSAAYHLAGSPAVAIPLFESTLAARERVLGPDRPSTLTSRATSLLPTRMSARSLRRSRCSS